MRPAVLLSFLSLLGAFSTTGCETLPPCPQKPSYCAGGTVITLPIGPVEPTSAPLVSYRLTVLALSTSADPRPSGGAGGTGGAGGESGASGSAGDEAGGSGGEVGGSGGASAGETGGAASGSGGAPADVVQRCLFSTPLNLVRCDGDEKAFFASLRADLNAPACTVGPPGAALGPDGEIIVTPPDSRCEVTASPLTLRLDNAQIITSVTLTLERNGIVSAPLEVRPVYAEQYPDGAHCPARCAQSAATLSIADFDFTGASQPAPLQ